MERTDPRRARVTPDREGDPEGDPPPEPLRIGRLLLQIFLPLVGVLAFVMVVGALFREELHALGVLFVSRFGYAGMAAGTFLSDAFMFPVPPQFYMLTSVAAGAPQLASITVICATSVLAANVAYHVAGRMARVPYFAARIAASRGLVDPLFARWGYYAVAVGAVLPVPFSLLCYVAGLYRIPYRLYVVLVLLRVPRLLAFYVLIRAGWGF